METTVSTDTNVTDSGVNLTTPCLNQYCVSDEDYLVKIEEYLAPTAGEWVAVSCFIVIFIIGIVGNFLVCFAVWRNRVMRSVTNLFIVNLAVADFMVIFFCLPPSLIMDVYETWFFGTVMCKFVLFFQTVSVSVSVLTLSAISIERWYAICHPLKFKSTLARARTIIIGIWIFAGSVSVPEFVNGVLIRYLLDRYSHLTFMTTCRPNWSGQGIYHMFLFGGLYIFPFCLMTFAYIKIALVLWREQIPGNKPMLEGRSVSAETQLQSRRKAAKMLITIVVLFGLFNMPVHILNITRYTKSSLEQLNALAGTVALISHCLFYVNSAINPIIYNFMSAKFRKEFQSVFTCCTRPCQEAAPPRNNWGETYNITYSRTNGQTEQFTLTTIKD